MRGKTLLFAVLGMIACSQGDRPAPADGGSVVEDRRWRQVAFDTLWSLGGDPRDTLLGFPSRLASVGTRVVFSDPGFVRVVALDAKSGAISWIRGGRGVDRALFEKPLMLAVAGTDSVLVVDDHRRTTTLLGPGGKTLRVFDSTGTGAIDALCHLSRGRTVLATSDSAGPLFLTTFGRTRPTPIPVSIPGLDGMHPLLLQGQLTRRADGKACAWSLDFGNWIALTDGHAFVKFARFREEVTVPRIDTVRHRRELPDGFEETVGFRMSGDTRGATTDVAAAPGRIRVLFGGATKYAGAIVDDFDDQTLEYLGSVRLPFGASALTAPAPDVLILLTERRGVPFIIALRQREVVP